MELGRASPCGTGFNNGSVIGFSTFSWNVFGGVTVLPLYGAGETTVAGAEQDAQLDDGQVLQVSQVLGAYETQELHVG
jgi:hypothetical protein